MQASHSGQQQARPAFPALGVVVTANPEVATHRGRQRDPGEAAPWSPGAGTRRASTVTGARRSYAREALASRDRPAGAPALPGPRDRGAAHLNPHVGSRAWLRCARSCPSVGSGSGTSSGWVRF